MAYKLTVADIDLLLENVKLFADDMTIANERIVEKLVSEGAKIARQTVNSAPYSGTEPSIIVDRITSGGKKGYIALRGKKAVYDEFGTGEEGADSPHPLKNNFALNPYNSGPTIRVNPITDRHYWIIPDGYYVPSEYVQEGGYTEGIPAGKQMYNTSIYLHSIKDEVIKKELQDTIKKFNKKG